MAGTLCPRRSGWVAGWIALCALGLAGCSAGSGGYARPPYAERAAPGSGHVTLASWYGPGFIGRRTADGEVYDGDGMTAASRTLPLGSRVPVTNHDNGRSVVVRINDRGPYVYGRSIDLSQRAAKEIGLDHTGVARVSVGSVDAGASTHSVFSRWSGEAQTKHYTPYHYTHPHYYRHRWTSRYRQSHRMVANPVGDWLLRMLG